MLACGPVDLADSWAELEAAAVLSDHRFAHDLVYETTLAGVPAAIARDMHGAVAQVLLRNDADAARIAEHWLHAGATDKAQSAGCGGWVRGEEVDDGSIVNRVKKAEEDDEHERDGHECQTGQRRTNSRIKARVAGS